MNRLISRSRGETVEIGARYGTQLRPGDVVALTGELGSGKTSFVVGACRTLGVSGPVISPTFTLIHEYRGPEHSVAHVDLYRISRRDQLAELGMEEYFEEPWVCFIEWAERAGNLLPAGTRRVRFEHGTSALERVVTLDTGR
jgi:tRNA threonylcarbamoyladenosine biosynthesis protein TsaE